MSERIGELINNDDLIKEIKEILPLITEKYRKAAKFGGKEKNYERPFCYEFYHKLRVEQENTNSLISKMDLHCELPKGYRKLNRTPDLVIHKQKTDKQNSIVIEVSRVAKIKNENNMDKEIKKFNDYHKHLKYQSYIELVLGGAKELYKLRNSISNKRRIFEKFKKGDYKINFWFYDIDSGKLQDDEELI